MERKFPSKILVFVAAITHNCDNFSCWSQIFYILPSIWKDFILPSQIRFFERAFWVRQKFLVANRHFSCSDISKLSILFFLKEESFMLIDPEYNIITSEYSRNVWSYYCESYDVDFNIYNSRIKLQIMKNKWFMGRATKDLINKCPKSID